MKEQKELMSTPIGVVRDAAFFKNVKRVTVIPKTDAREIDREKKVVKAVKPGEWRRKRIFLRSISFGGRGVPGCAFA